MPKSRSVSHVQYNTIAISSKLSLFREKFNQSQQKFNQKYTRDISSPKKLAALKTPRETASKQFQAKSRPSSGMNHESSTKKQILNIMIDSSELNPERRFTLMDLKGSILLSQLDSKAKEMTGYAEENAALLARKSNLQNKIAQLKRSIAQEKKKLSETQCNCGILTNNIQLTEERYREKNQLAKQLARRIQDTKSDNKDLKKRLAQNQAESDYNKKHIELLENQIDELSLNVTNTNVSLMRQNGVRLQTKDQLTLQLKVMENDAILYRQLVSQQSNVQAQIDKAFYDNKMESSREGGKSRISINSNKK